LNAPAPSDATLPSTRTAAASSPHRAGSRWLPALALVGLLLTVLALALAWTTQQRVKSLERELVRRQTDSQAQAAEARVAARAAQELARESAAKTALVEARVSEASMQRSQIEDLLQSVSRSRDENVVADVEAAVRVALQQSALTGSGEPLVATLKQADERLARYNQPRLERVRRAVNRDLDRVKALGVIDIASLSVRLDEAIRQVDELPLLALAVPRGKAPATSRSTATPTASTPAPASAAAAAASAGSANRPADADWRVRAGQWWSDAVAQVVGEIRSLVRITRIDQPEAMLVAPEQQFFVRENLKLRLLNARLALLSRQFEIAQSDIRDAQAALDRYFERGSKRSAALADLLRQVSTQARQTGVPRPDETLAALATAAAGR